MAKYSVRDTFGRFAKLIGGVPQEREAPLRDALGHYVTPPAPRPIIPIPPAIAETLPQSRQEREFQRAVDSAIEAKDLYGPGDKPELTDYWYDPSPEMYALWEEAPVEDMTDGQIRAFVDMVIAAEDESW